MKKTFLLVCLAGVLFVGIAAQNAGASPHPQLHYQQPGTTYRVNMTIYLLQHKPTIGPGLIRLVLAGAHSPAAGDSQALYDLGVQYGIDPAYALAFFHHESSYGTSGEATITRSLGNERCVPDRPCNAANFAVFSSWVDGFAHWYSLILTLYIRQWHLLTVAQIIPRYAPASDGNDEAGYIAAVEQDVSAWRSESQVSA